MYECRSCVVIVILDGWIMSSRRPSLIKAMTVKWQCELYVDDDDDDYHGNNKMNE